MRKKYFFLILSSIHSLVGANVQDYGSYATSFPPSAFIKTKAIVETFNLSEGLSPEESAGFSTKSEYEALASLNDERLIIRFSPKETLWYRSGEGKNPDAKNRRDVIYVYDGSVWQEFLYSISNSISDKKIERNELTVSDKSPGGLYGLLDFYTGKNFLWDRIPFFKAGDINISLSDMIFKAPKFPPFTIERNGDEVHVSSKTTTHMYDAKFRMENKLPVLSSYRKTNLKASGHEGMISEYNFSGRIQLLNSAISIPNKMEYIFSEKNGNIFKAVITFDSVSLITEEYFRKQIPEITAGWKIKDELKGIMYRKGDSKEKILESIKGL